MVPLYRQMLINYGVEPFQRNACTADAFFRLTVRISAATQEIAMKIDQKSTMVPDN